MKSILIVDTPKDCGHCRLSDFVDGDSCLCRKADRKSKSNEKPKWCPLKNLPEPKDIGYPNDDYDVGFGDGWDACLKELEK